MVDGPTGQAAGMVNAEAVVEAAETRHVCANCGTAVQRRYCPECGQKTHLHTRLSHLIEEFAEGIAHFDGRLWRTLPLLVLRPGRLSREWREGRRARYVPPLHLFLFAVFLFFTVSALEPEPSGTKDAPAAQSPVYRRTPPPPPKEGMRLILYNAAEWLDQATRDYYGEDAKYYEYKGNTLLYKTAPAVAPISVAILWLLLWRRRGFTLYDHAVVSLYGLSAATLAATLVSPLTQFVGWLWFPFWGLMFVHAVVHLHGAYGTSWVGAVLRGLGLAVLTAISFSLFLLSVFVMAAAG